MAEDIRLTARGQGYYRVYVNDVLGTSHTTEREAVEAAENWKRDFPDQRVRYQHDYVVDVTLAVGPVPVPPSVEPPPPVPDPDPVPLPPPPPAPPSPEGILFASSWDTARGNQQAAVSDGGRWQQIGGENSVGVVLADGLDFPAGMANVLEVAVNGTRSGYWHGLHTGITPPAIGGSLFYRWYIRVVMPDDLPDSGTHPIQDNYAQNWDFQLTNGAGNVNMRLDAGSSRWTPPNLPKGLTYRWEWQLHRTGASTYQAHVRVYDSADNLIQQDADFRDQNSQRTLAQNPDNALSNLNALGGITCGINGVTGLTTQATPIVLTYQGGFCIRADTWCGPYVPGEGR